MKGIPVILASELVPTQEVAAHYGLHGDTVRNAIKAGRLPAVTLAGRYLVTMADAEKVFGEQPDRRFTVNERPGAPAGVLPIDSPSRTQLWYRHQLALSLLDQRGHTADTAALVARALRGESIEDLRESEVLRGA